MTSNTIKNLIFVDCEGHGPAPTLNDAAAFEFGAAAYPSKQTFHGTGATKETFEKFDKWIASVIEKGFTPLDMANYLTGFRPLWEWLLDPNRTYTFMPNTMKSLTILSGKQERNNMNELGHMKSVRYGVI